MINIVVEDEPRLQHVTLRLSGKDGGGGRVAAWVA